MTPESPSSLLSPLSSYSDRVASEPPVRYHGRFRNGNGDAIATTYSIPVGPSATSS